jgi:phosphoglycolate phosphatase
MQFSNYSATWQNLSQKLPWELIIFDWDGTLADSTARIIHAMQQAALACQLVPPAAADVAAIIGLALPEALTTLFPNASPAALACLHQHYRQWFLYDSDYSEALFPGMVELLHDLQQAGFLLAIATGKSRVGLNRALRKNRLRTCFAYSCCADESASKPNPLMLKKILAACALPASAACLVGDSVFDIQMAQTLAVMTQAVGFGAGHPGALQALQPDYYFATPSALIHFWQTILTELR